MEYIDLGKICNIKTGKLDANASSENGNYPFFTCSKEPLKIDSYSYDCECILVAGNGDLNVKYYNGKFDAYQRTYIIEAIDKMKYSTKFLYLLINSKIDELRKASIGGVIKYIKLGNLTNIKVPVLSIEEQQKIVEKMFSMDRVLEIKKNQIFKFEELIKSQFVEMFGDPKTNEKGWIKKCMGEYMTVLTDFSSNGSYKILDSTVTMYDEPNYAYMVRTTDLENEDFKNNVKYITEEAYNFLSKSKVYPNDIIMNKIGSAGKVYIMPDVGMPVSLGRNAFLFRYNNNIEPVFIYYLLKSEYGVNEISQYIRGAVTKTITKDDVRKIKIIVPPMELQNKFAQIVEQIDKQKFEFEKSLKKLEELQASLMQEYFG